MALIDNIASDFKTISSGEMTPLRREAFEAFQKLGIPSARHEEWRYTHIKTKLPETLRMISASVGSPELMSKINLFSEAPGDKLVFVNGRYAHAHSHITGQSGLVAGSMREMRSTHKYLFDKYFNKSLGLDSEPFAALNTAFAEDGAFVYVQKEANVELPLYIIHVYDGQAVDEFTQSRNLIVVEDNASVQIVEDFQNTGGDKCYNHVSEVQVGSNADVKYTFLQLGNAHTTSVNEVFATLAADARYHLTGITLDGKMVRNNMTTSIQGSNAEATLLGLYLGTASNHIDNHILIDHRVPHCQSHQVYKGVLEDESTGVFNGKIFVKEDAQKTNAFQSSKAILLSDAATMNSKPQLEIFADDVKCSHGAAIGQVSKNELFYLKARGLDEETAKSILTFAFASEIIEAIALPEMREYLDVKLKERLKISF